MELRHPYYRNYAHTRTPTSEGRLGMHAQAQNMTTANLAMGLDVRNQGDRNYPD